MGDLATSCPTSSRLSNGMPDDGQDRQTHLTENRRKEAVTWFAKALKESTKHGDNTRIAIAYSSMGCAYRQMGKLLKAITCHEGAVSALYKVGDREMLGKAYLE